GFEAQIAAARARGHEILVHVPMQPIGAEDAGPGALTIALDRGEIRRRLAAALDRAGPAVGINNHMGSRFTADRAGMATVFAELSRRGLLFLDSRTTAETRAPELAPRYRLPLAARDVFLDHTMTPAAVAAALAKTEETARRNGLAIAIGHPHDVTVAALERWLPTLAEKGFALVPLSAAVQQPGL
ncbi:MAG TPA: divergent polysaccharide deacetylase family protein, partial [Alphaproteobacteria bacterium]|nr:divergent polysaccharide deacetylase family protein [Alphaproteobacteria bacterium]